MLFGINSPFGINHLIPIILFLGEHFLFACFYCAMKRKLFLKSFYFLPFYNQLSKCSHCGNMGANGNMFNTVIIVVEIRCPVLNTSILQTYHGFIFLFSNTSQSNTQTCLLGHAKQTTRNTKYCNFSTFLMFGRCFSAQNIFPTLQ